MNPNPSDPPSPFEGRDNITLLNNLLQLARSPWLVPNDAASAPAMPSSRSSIPSSGINAAAAPNVNDAASNALASNILAALVGGSTAQANNVSILPQNTPNHINAPVFVNNAPKPPGPPVGSSTDDEMHLVRALFVSEGTGQTYRQAIESLHGVNNHTSASWKDYYLDHVRRINGFVDSLRNAPRPKTSSPSIPRSHTTQVNQPSSSRPVSMPSGIVTPVSSSSSKPHGFHSARAHALQSNLSFRDTSSSQGRYHTRKNGAAGERDRVHAQTSARDRRARSPSVVHILDSDGEESDDDEIQLPARQLRSPTPPTRVQHHARGIRFTEEDHTFFLKTLQWEFQNSPRASRDDVCRKMASKTRHHDADGWSRYWSRHKSVVDTIRKTAPASSSLSITNNDKRKARANRADESSDDESEDGQESDNESDPPTDEDAQKLGTTGDLYTDVELRLFAKHIARTPNWLSLTRSQRFGDFRAKAYAAFYEGRKKKIHNLAKKYRQKTAKYTDERVSTTKKPVSAATEQKPLSSGVIQNSLKRSREGAELLYLDISEPDAKHQRLGTF
ncbi:predicted protein [Postia placenta Mad-698-R]|uniref:Rap1 Myb domain-containing protein n=1 Tax=Postia placenta MAD-698-R-SB12 TaxID=670580 RepID=A0A1X6NG20_9APHY|nr:hypothetical protein POSPLADRAFT_1129721 [Postia placenta MAD-698-R-SB12]EED83967.1 predicted protein [Postia placenta Mad-698-R]OSX67470.1 hypothetical protein POSPLADRAFT_1129721 [Postia placenta MAD-698-R-SB12]